MADVKIPKSVSYEEYLIESLKNIEESAGFIEAILEEENPESHLLRDALRKVVIAQTRINNLSPIAKHYGERLDRILTESGCAEIYAFVQFLDAIGLKIAIAPLAPEPSNLTLETENHPEKVTA
ncbi:MAG: transcriptional regulator [Microcoleaceae cyanobacterium]